MALSTSNIYGRINVSEEAVAAIASKSASECYGVVELVSKGIADSIAQLFNKSTPCKGVKVITIDNTVFFDVYLF